MTLRGDEGRPLVELPVLLLDAQATAASPARGALLEIGWASVTAAASSAGDEVDACVVAPPPGVSLPRAVARITGLTAGEWERGVCPATAWRRLLEAAAEVSSPPVPLVIHFARFEEPFLRALYERHGTGPFPFELVCTHKVALRLLPGLPRRTLRALAGYFGVAVPALRRSADHVVATACVWRHLVGALGREGIGDLAGLREWLARPAPRRSARSYPLPRERRRELPRGPGVYRFLRAGGGVAYVGKATSLRQRVSSHFHAPGGERALEMLSQVREVSCTETATALEAALLEADEIKRLAPPYNRALTAGDRSLWFATVDLDDLRQAPDDAHTVGPLASPAPFEALHALRAGLATDHPVSLAARARAVGTDPVYAPGPECFAAGLARFVEAHGRLSSTRDVLRVGAGLWAAAPPPPADSPNPARMGCGPGGRRPRGSGAPRGPRRSPRALAGAPGRVLSRLDRSGAARETPPPPDRAGRRGRVRRRGAGSGGADPDRSRGPQRLRPPGRLRRVRLRPPAGADDRAAGAGGRRPAARAATRRPRPTLPAPAADGAALGVTALRVLFVSDTHLGFDLPLRPRVERRRRGPDFFACFERALEPALRGEADVVVHGGDLLYRSRVPASLVQRALAPLARVAASGVPVLLVPGNHERSEIPYPLLLAREGLHVFTRPSTFVVERRGLRIAFAGFPYARDVRRRFPDLLAATGYRAVDAGIRVLCLHHCVEGAVCGPPPGYTFRDGDDVIAARDLPGDVAVVLCGHVHRHQVLRRDLRGRPLRAPVVYAGSVERTSFAEREEPKGYVVLTLTGGGSGRLEGFEFRPLPARPMLVHELSGRPPGLEHELSALAAAAPPDVVLQLRVPESLAGHPALRADRLRRLAGPSANVTLSPGRHTQRPFLRQ